MALIYIYVHIITKLLSFCLKKTEKEFFFAVFKEFGTPGGTSQTSENWRENKKKRQKKKKN